MGTFFVIKTKQEGVVTDSDISHEDLSLWNPRQLEEMLGDDNRNYFRNTHGREPEDNNELIFYYIKK